ncbi:hypothetical protein WDM22_00670 [Bradyrhizobium septentrionale]|uniref:hypothetical protein n=1 Tax=Bradyrhizobium septentrionale TaxID=1404411 RepID=UPI0030CD7E49
MIAWLGLWGPLDLSHLKEWQTLMASMVALIAAGVAYRGATAKVRYDREVAERDDMRRKLALYLKVEIAFVQLIETVRSRQSKFTFAPILENEEFSARDFDFEEPPELEEAWTSLDIFPRHLIAEIRNVRSALRKMASFKAQMGDRKIRFKTADPWDKPWLVEQANEALSDTWHSAAVVVEDLKPLIQELAPEMDESDRLHKIHGSPGPDDFDEGAWPHEPTR